MDVKKVYRVSENMYNNCFTQTYATGSIKYNLTFLIRAKKSTFDEHSHLDLLVLNGWAG